MVCGLNSAGSKAVGEGWKVGKRRTCRRSYCATSESGLPGIRAFVENSPSIPLACLPPSSSLTSVQSDLCLFKIQPPLADSAPAVSHPPELMNPQSYFQFWSGWGGSQSSPRGGGGRTQQGLAVSLVPVKRLGKR